MAKNKNKKGFATMDFLIVGGIAAVAYFLFSSFSRGPINTGLNNGAGGGETPTPTPTPAPTGGGMIPQNTTVDFVRFNDTQINVTLTKGGVGQSSNSPMVMGMQMFLKKAGWNIGIYGADGIFGDDTETALKGYLRWTSFLPVATDLKELGVRAVKVSTNQIFGYDPNGIFQTGVYYEYLGPVSGWKQTPDSIMATSNTI